MIQAALQGKSFGTEYSEDMLTSTVFGTLRYLPLDSALIPFIEEAFLYDEVRTPFWKVLNKDGIQLRCYEKVEYIFWTRHSTFGEPDLILLFTDHVHGEEDLLLVVEAKFKSPKSGVGEFDQLMRYHRAITEQIEDFSHIEVANFRGKKGYMIYLTESEASDEIKDSMERIKKIDKDSIKGIFHLRWHQLHKILSNRLESNSSMESLIANDIIQYLERLGLREFSGISSPEKCIISTINSEVPIFYNKNSNSLYFNSLPKVSIGKKDYFFYKEIKE